VALGVACVFIVARSDAADSSGAQGIAAVTQGSFPEWDLHPDIERHEVHRGVALDIAGFWVEFFRAEHRVPTVAVRVSQGSRTFAFSADTTACDQIIACARNADLFDLQCSVR